jgi:hypothetical protein
MRNHLPPPSFSHHLLRGKESESGYFSLWTDIMNVIPNAYRIYRRQASGYFYPGNKKGHKKGQFLILIYKAPQATLPSWPAS